MRMITRWAVVLAIMAFASPCRAELRLEFAAVDLGEIRAGLRWDRELVLTNTGADVAVIQEVRGSCGCLAGRVEPTAIAPGSQARLSVRLNTLGEGAGPHSWKASVRYQQAGETRQVEATFRASIVTEITVQPASLALISEGGISQSVVLTDYRLQPMKVMNVGSTARFLKTRLLDQGKDAGGQWTAKIGIDLDQDIPAGRHDEVLSIYTDDALYSELRVPVVIFKNPPASKVTLSPSSVCFSRNEQTSSRMVRLRGVKDIRIEKIESQNPALACNWVSGPNDEAFIKIRADVSRLKGSRQASVQVYLAAPATEVLTIPVLLEAGERETAER